MRGRSGALSVTILRVPNAAAVAATVHEMCFIKRSKTTSVLNHNFLVCPANPYGLPRSYGTLTRISVMG